MHDSTRHLIGYSLVALLVICICAIGCGARQKCQDPAQRNTVECAVVNSIVDCTTANATQLETQFGPVVQWLIAKATGADGSIDWGQVTDTVKSFGIADGMCVIATVVEDLTQKSTAAGGPGRPSHDSLATGFDQLRAKVAPGIRFHTPRGDL